MKQWLLGMGERTRRTAKRGMMPQAPPLAAWPGHTAAPARKVLPDAPQRDRFGEWGTLDRLPPLKGASAGLAGPLYD